MIKDIEGLSAELRADTSLVRRVRPWSVDGVCRHLYVTLRTPPRGTAPTVCIDLRSRDVVITGGEGVPLPYHHEVQAWQASTRRTLELWRDPPE